MAALLVLGACSRENGDDDGTTVVASFFALAEIARAVAPEAKVIDLTPPGVEPHDLELSAEQVDQIEDADVVVLMGAGFQPAIERAAKRAEKTVVVDPKSRDPHIWLDPVRMQDVARQIAEAVPGGDAAAMVADLAALDRAYADGLRDCDRRIIVTAHDAFRHLAFRYSLEPQWLSGSPETEPTAERLAQMADLLKRTGSTTVFAEKLVSSKAAESVAREAGVKTEVLDTLESGEPGTYLTTMRENLAKLRAALGCR